MTFLKDFLTKRNIPFQEDESGVLYNITEEGTGTFPEAGQYVRVHYTGKFLDGKVFDSSVDRGQPFVFPLGESRVIQGWDKGIPLIPIGGKGNLYLTSDLAYGDQGSGSIPPKASLTFEVEVLEVLDAAAFAAHQKEEQEQQMKILQEYYRKQLTEEIPKIQEHAEKQGKPFQMTDTGLHFYMETEGTGAQAEAGKTVSVHYQGKLLSGQVFDASYNRGEPISFMLGQGQVIQGWDEGIALFKVGGKGTLLIPSPLAYGPRAMGPIPANSVLEFDIELVNVE